MKRIIYCIIFFLYLIPLYSQEYSYKVFWEDGIYERNIKNVFVWGTYGIFKVKKEKCKSKN